MILSPHCYKKAYYISSRALSPVLADAAVHGHWAIENAQHWQLDVIFGEDGRHLRHP